MTAFPISTSPTAWFPAQSVKTSIVSSGVRWSRIRPAAAKPSEEYEQGWNAINELIRSDHTWSGYERNVFYANNRDGTFSDVSGAVGLDFIEDGRAFALTDFDHDGRQEFFLKNRTAPQLRLLKNVADDLPPSISFRLRGTKSNPDAIGAASAWIARLKCFRPAPDFFRSTARMCSSVSGKPRSGECFHSLAERIGATTP